MRLTNTLLLLTLAALWSPPSESVTWLVGELVSVGFVILAFWNQSGMFDTEKGNPHEPGRLPTQRENQISQAP